MFKRFLLSLVLLCVGLAPLSASELVRYSSPAERDRGCSWADGFESQALVETNGGAVTGSPAFSPDGVVLDGANDYLTYNLLGSEFASAEISIVIEFTPDFEAADGSNHTLLDSTAGSRNFIRKNDIGTFLVMLNNTTIANIPLLDYQAAWLKDERNVLVVSSTTGDTSAWLNGTIILSADISAWSAGAPVTAYVGATNAGAHLFDGTIHRLQVYKTQLADIEAERISNGYNLGVPSGAIQTLIDAGALVLYQDYRSGHALDLSGQGNDGTPSGVVWSRDGARFGTASKITVANSAELEAITSGCILFGGEFLTNPPAGTYQRIVEKEDAVGRQFSLVFNSNVGLLLIGSSGASQAMNLTFSGEKCLAVNFGNGVAPELFADGTSVVTAGGVNTIASDDVAITLGARYDGGQVNQFPMFYLLIFNRALTPTEHAAVYAELIGMRWPQKQDRAAPSYGGDAATELQWGTDWGTPVIANVAPGAKAGPFTVGSGAVAIVTREVAGRTVKAIQRTNDCGFSISAGEMRQTPSDAAFGTWEWGINRPASGVIYLAPISGGTDATAGGAYSIRLLADGSISLYENGVGSLIAGAGAITDGVDHVVRLTRSAAGLFALYVDGVLIGTATDLTVVVSAFLAITMTGAACEVNLADVGGSHAFNKFQGVVTP